MTAKNSKQGGVIVRMGDNDVRLALTLGALAEIEEGLKIENLEELNTRFDNPKIKDLIVVVTALVVGGNSELSMEEARKIVMSWEAAPSVILDKIMEVFKSSSMVEGEDEGNETDK